MDKVLLLCAASDILREVQATFKGGVYMHSPSTFYPNTVAFHFTDHDEFYDLFPHRKYNQFINWGTEEDPHIHEIHYVGEIVFFILIQPEDVPEGRAVMMKGGNDEK